MIPEVGGSNPSPRTISGMVSETGQHGRLVGMMQNVNPDNLRLSNEVIKWHPIDDKLYIIVRSDLSPGLQAAQACHGLRLFVEEHEETDQKWYTESNNLVLLQVPNETELLALRDRANGIPSSLFREPDVNDEATALTLGPEAKGLVSNLPLLLKAPS